MDRKTAFKILKIDPSASREEARKAYRNLAKQFHPDVAGATGGRSGEDNRMIEINLAFRYLAPRLSSNKGAGKTTPVEKEKKSKTPEKKVPEPKTTPSLFSRMIDWFLLIGLNRKKKRRPVETSHRNGKKMHKTPPGPVRFADVFNRVHPDRFAREKTAGRPGRKTSTGKSPPCDRFKKYMSLKRKMTSRPSDSPQDVSIGRIDKISPVKPVNPVGRH